MDDVSLCSLSYPVGHHGAACAERLVVFDGSVARGFAAVVVLPVALNFLGLHNATNLLLRFARWPLLIVVIVLGLAALSASLARCHASGQVLPIKRNCDRTRDYTCALSAKTFLKRSGASDASQNWNSGGGFSSLRHP